MILYYSPGACSQAPHILMHELGFSHEARRVDLKDKRVEDGSSYLEINPKGSVPALQLENGEVLTENAVILQFLGDRSGSPDALPGVGHFRRHDASDEMKAFVAGELGKKLDYIEQKLGNGPFLMGDELTLPDPYLFVIAGWTEKSIGLDRWPRLRAFRERMMRRPSVRNVLAFEGLLQEEAAE